MTKGRRPGASKAPLLSALFILAAGGALCLSAQAQEIGPAADAAALVSIPENPVSGLSVLPDDSELWSEPPSPGAVLGAANLAALKPASAAAPNFAVETPRASALNPRQASEAPRPAPAAPPIAAPRASRGIAGPRRALERAGRLKASAALIFDGSQAAAAAPAQDDFPVSARTFYSGNIGLARKIPLKPSHLANLKDRIGLGTAAIFCFSGRAQQVGKTCAAEALAACAEANGRKDPALLTKIMTAAKRVKIALIEESLAESERAKEELLRQGLDAADIEKKITGLTLRAILVGDAFEHEGLSRKEQRRTAAAAGLDYRVLGRARGLADAIGPEASKELLAKFRRNSASLKRKIDEELSNKNAVMAGVYTGVRKDGGSGFHALTILGRGRKPSGIYYYIVYDSNLGRPMLYMAKKLLAIHAAIVR